MTDVVLRYHDRFRFLFPNRPVSPGLDVLLYVLNAQLKGWHPSIKEITAQNFASTASLRRAIRDLHFNDFLEKVNVEGDRRVVRLKVTDRFLEEAERFAVELFRKKPDSDQIDRQ